MADYNLELVKELFANRKFVSLDSLKTGNKKFYTLTGAKTAWKTDPDLVYSYQLRVTADSKAFADFLKDLSADVLTSLAEVEDVKMGKLTKKELQNSVITFKNYQKGKTAELFKHEVECYTKLKKAKAKKKKYYIEEVYAAFQVYKTQKNDIKPRKTPVKMSDIGETYQNLGENEVLNVFNYASKEPKAEVETVEDVGKNKYEFNGKVMYKVPNYRLVSSKKTDIQTVLRDLVAQDVIELKKKDIKALVDEWTELKSENASNKIKSPKKLGESNSKMPQSTKHKIRIVKS